MNLGNFAMSKGENGQPGKFFCKPHYRQLFMANPEVGERERGRRERGGGILHVIPRLGLFILEKNIKEIVPIVNTYSIQCPGH